MNVFKKIKENYKAILLFIIAIAISYTLIYIVTPGDFFKSPMYMILPIVGFFGFFFTSKYFMEYMQIKSKYKFSLLFVIVAVFSYYLAIFFFYWNIIVLNDLSAKELFKFVFQNYNLFLTSAFLEFIISSAFGIVAIK